MTNYMIQFSYSSESVRGMIAKPQDRRQAAAKIIEAAGGRLLDFYFSFGEFDGMGIVEFSSDVDAAAASLVIGASGGFAKVETTVLISMDDAVKAMEKARDLGGSYKPPGT